MENKWVSDPKDVELEEAVNRAVRQMGFHIHIIARDGQVTVSGTADDFETKKDIILTVRSMPGVRRVISQIRIAPIAD